MTTPQRGCWTEEEESGCRERREEVPGEVSRGVEQGTSTCSGERPGSSVHRPLGESPQDTTEGLMDHGVPLEVGGSGRAPGERRRADCQASLSALP